MMLVEFDQTVGIIRMTISGFQSLEAHQTGMARFAEIALAIRARGQRVLMLTDAREAQVQSADIVDFYAQNSAGELLVDKSAALLSSTLYKMQSRRMMGDLTIAIFDDPDRAVAWLLEEAASPIKSERAHRAA